MNKISSSEIQKKLTQLKLNWEVTEENKIKREFKFKDFKEAIQFVNKIAKIAEQIQHHPDICISYNKVIIELWTHSIGGLSENDFLVASKIEKLNQ